MTFLCVIFVFFTVYATRSTSDDPCGNHDIIRDDTRASNLKLDLVTTHPFTDDRLKPGWYRVKNTVGELMPTYPPEPFMCNTLFPIWLNGSFPDNVGNVSTEIVCLRNFYETCKWSWNIRIKKCPGDFYVYELDTSPIIDAGYCFGWASPCINRDSSVNTRRKKRSLQERTHKKAGCEKVTVPSTTLLNTEQTSENSDDFRDHGLVKTVDTYIYALIFIPAFCVSMMILFIVYLMKHRAMKPYGRKQACIFDTATPKQKINNPVYFLEPGKEKHLEDLPPEYSTISYLNTKCELEIPTELFRAK